MSSTADKFARYVLPTYARFPLTLVRGEGSFVWSDQGTRYLDFCTGIAVCSLGHCHPRFTKAIQDQAAKLTHISNLYHIEEQANLAEMIVEKFVREPGRVFFSNSGAEANDGLIKAARRYGHARPDAHGNPRFEVLTFHSSFHGRTLGSMAATGQDKIKVGFDPMLPGFRHLPFNDLAAVEAAIRPETVAVLLEPIQGEGGIHVADDQFLHGLADLCKRHDLLLFFDEVQSGFGRTGNRCAFRSIAPEIKADGLSWAKGMGGGIPIGAFWLSDRLITDSDKRVSDLMDAGSHGSTYGGNPLVCAGSLAVLSEIHEQELWKNAIHQNHRIRQAIDSWHSPAIKEMRGLGLMIGFHLDAKAIPTPEDKTTAGFLVAQLMQNGLLCVPAGPDTLRWLPALNVTDAEVDEALAILHQTLAQWA